jgi:hypothetical protein
MNPHFGGTYHLHLQSRKSAEQETREADARRYIPEDGIFHNYRCENLKSYKKRRDQTRRIRRKWKRRGKKSICTLKAT